MQITTRAVGKITAMIDFEWNAQNEARVISLRDEGRSYVEIGAILGTTATSVKHKFRRLSQSQNDDRYHHPVEKSEQVARFLPNPDGSLRIYESHCGFGNMTQIWATYGEVLSVDTDKERTALVAEVTNAEVITENSILTTHRLVGERRTFDVVDIDPYGLPSRYFPHAFSLLTDGYLFLTFPKLGATQINKITLEHLRVWWGVTQENKSDYEQVILNRLNDYAIANYRELTLLDTVDLGRMYRYAFRVVKRSALELVGLEVNRNTKPPQLPEPVPSLF